MARRLYKLLKDNVPLLPTLAVQSGTHGPLQREDADLAREVPVLDHARVEREARGEGAASNVCVAERAEFAVGRRVVR